jgi:hypothetical protein
MRRVSLLSTLVVLAISLFAVSTAHARPLVGIGDQNVAMFDDPKFQKLHVELTRLALAWDWYRDPSAVAFLDQWVAAADRAGARPLIAFNRNWRDGGDRYRVPLTLYRKSFRLIRQRYPQIRDFQAWNEANHTSQPTAKSPRLAAKYYKALVAMCRKCNVVAADVLDTNAMPAWIAQFKRYAPKARLWGLHSYKDPNNGTDWHLRAFLKQVKGRIWLTETGGIKRLKPLPGSRGNGRYNTLHGQARALKRVFALAKIAPRRINRIYFYQWRQARGERWDSAFLDARGRSRPVLFALRSALKRR